MERTPVLLEPILEGALSAQLRRSRPQSAVSAQRRLATFNRLPQSPPRWASERGELRVAGPDRGQPAKGHARTRWQDLPSQTDATPRLEQTKCRRRSLNHRALGAQVSDFAGQPSGDPGPFTGLR